MRPHRPLLAAGLLVAALCVPAVLPAAGGDPVVGIDALKDVGAAEGLDEALARWSGKGISGAVLLHVGARPGLAALGAERLAALRELRTRGDAAALGAARRGPGEGLYHAGNAVRAAAGLGMVREVLWILPESLTRASDPAALVRDVLRAEGVPEAERTSFAARGGCFAGAAGGVPVTICSREAFPPPAEPVLLSMDAAYVPDAADAREVSPLTELRDLLRDLGRGGVAVRDALVVFPVEQGGLPVGLIWVGEALTAALADPGLLRAGTPPERWTTLLKAWRALGTEEQHNDIGAFTVVVPALERHPDDPELLAMAALATARTSPDAQAIEVAERACRRDRTYCFIFPEIGLELIRRGKEAGLAFFAAGERLRPGMAYALGKTGVALIRLGRPRDAVSCFQRLVAREGAFPAGLLAGATEFDLGDRAAARRSFDAVLAALGQAGEPGPLPEEIALAAARAAAFYREEGLAAQAEILERDPRLVGAGH
jgi:hypothetical protein